MCTHTLKQTHQTTRSRVPINAHIAQHTQTQHTHTHTYTLTHTLTHTHSHTHNTHTTHTQHTHNTHTTHTHTHVHSTFILPSWMALLKARAITTLPTSLEYRIRAWEPTTWGERSGQESPPPHSSHMYWVPVCVGLYL